MNGVPTKTQFVKFVGLIAVLTVSSVVGCGAATKPAPNKSTPITEHKQVSHEHEEHGTGPHGGVIADWGGGTYHVEFTVDHDNKEATVYVLGSDEKTPTPIKANGDALLLAIQSPSFQVTMKASPLDGEPEGTSSRFVGKHDNLGIVQEFSGTIKAKIGDLAYVGDFKEEPHGAHEHK